MKMGKYEESITQYKKALELNANFVASHIGIATNLNFLGEHEKARERLQHLNEIARNDGEKRAAHFAAAVSYMDEGFPGKALDELQKQYDIAAAINDHFSMGNDLILMGNIQFE